MKLFFILASIYLSVSILLYVVFKAATQKGFVFKVPRYKWLFYLLSVTWGLPLTLFGSVVALVLFIKGKRPTRYGLCWCFSFANINWGLELGLFFIAPAKSDHTKNHELGHSIQNIYLGIFMPAVVNIPSLIRFWWRKFLVFIKKPSIKAYDDIWFEGSATRSGEFLMANLYS